MMKQRWGLDRNVLRPTPGDPWGVEQHHWNTGAEENQQLNPSGPSKAFCQKLPAVVFFSHILYDRTTPGKRSTCTPSVYYRKSIWLVTVYHLTCLNKHVAEMVGMLMWVYFFISLIVENRNSKNGNEYWYYRRSFHEKIQRISPGIIFAVKKHLVRKCCTLI